MGQDLSLKKRYYILFISRDADGTLNKVPIPLHYAYVFVAAAAIGLFTITGLAGSYTRMLVKTASFNELRRNRDSLRKDYAQLEQTAHEKDIQAASLGSLAGEVSALYGLTASKLAVPMAHLRPGPSGPGTAAKTVEAASAATAPLLSDQSYYKSLESFYALRTTAMAGLALRTDPGAISSSRSSSLGGLEHFGAGLGARFEASAGLPSLWPVMGPITSSFGQRDDPITGTGEGEFHKGVDISSHIGLPVRATGDGTVKSASMVNGYGREVVLDHGHGVETCYAHMSGFTVLPGQTVVRGQVIGYVGMSGRSTGAHLHYEVRIHDTPVNPHKYLRTTLADLGTESAAL